MEKRTDVKLNDGSKWWRTPVAVLFWIAVWQLASMAVGKELILPGPFAVLRALWSLVRTSVFWTSILMTVLRIMLGYLAGVALGCLLAFACSTSRILDSLFRPVVKTIRATPVASFIILAMLWMSKGGVPVLMSALIVAPVVWGNLMESYASRDKGLDEMAQVYRLGRWKRFRFILVPALLPSLRAACLTGLGFAWKSGIAAEVLSQPKTAIGSNIYYSKVYLETPELFAWTASVIALSFALEILVRKLIARRDPHED